MTLNQMIELADKMARHAANTGNKFIFPTFVGEDADGYIKHLILEEMPDKDAAAITVKEFLNENNIVRYFSVMEAWMLTTDKEEKIPENIMRGEPDAVKNHPARQEVVFIAAEDGETGRQRTAYIPISRDEEENLILAKTVITPTEGTFSGRFSSLLSERQGRSKNTIN